MIGSPCSLIALPVSLSFSACWVACNVPLQKRRFFPIGFYAAGKKRRFITGEKNGPEKGLFSFERHQIFHSIGEINIESIGGKIRGYVHGSFIDDPDGLQTDLFTES